jgi:hypothetical protein
MHRFFCLLLLLSGCIGTDILDDFVESEIVITNPVESIEIGTMYSFMAVYRNNVGMEEDVPLEWNSSAPEIISVDQEGIATASMSGDVMITVNGGTAEHSFMVLASDETTATPTLRTTMLETVSSYPMTGTATLEMEEGGLVLRLGEDFSTTSALPGLYVYLSNNPRSLADAYEISRVTDFSGAQEYEIQDNNVGLFDYAYVLFFCKPFVVPVGNGELNP